MNTFICALCRAQLKRQLPRNGKPKRRAYTRPSFAPKPIIDLKHIRQNPGLYEQNALDRNYPAQSKHGWRILEIHEALAQRQKKVLELRQRNKVVGKAIQRHANAGDDARELREEDVDALIEEARGLKEQLATFEDWEKRKKEEMEALGLEIVNLSSDKTPVGKHPDVVGWINGEKPPGRFGRYATGHVEIGKELDILDFEASATTSGWGWYFLKDDGALLEQALIQFALSVAMAKGWTIMTPPSLVYGHIASACGFMPRDQNGETQIYNIAQDEAGGSTDRPHLVLAGTAEIPFAASLANKTLFAKNMPVKVIGPSRCYRAEAGARGVDTKGLYRVHEFTKVEMFAWTSPVSSDGDRFGSGEEEPASQTEVIFREMLDIQTHILSSLGLHAKILEMPTTDLGASATRKIDIEAFFPSRVGINRGYGEVTSVSICTDYQSRRLGTRLSDGGGKLGWPHTLNGTALAVPRVLACILENGWNEETRTVTIPEVLRKWMPGGASSIPAMTSV